MRLVLGEAPFEGTGAGVRVGVIDSGIDPSNPHIDGCAGGVAVADNGALHHDVLDRLGHGTAVAAAIQEKAPDAEIHAIRVFERTLTTRAANLEVAIDWAAEQGLHLVNLSLGTARSEHRASLGRAVERAREAGLLVVSACRHKGVCWWPGSLDEAIGVVADERAGRHELHVVSEPETSSGGGPRSLLLGASPLPRPIPGVPPERNISGISFAVANATGFVARALQRYPAIGSAADLRARLEAASQGRH